MKSKKIFVLLAGVLFFLSIVLTLSWLLSPKSDPKELTFEQAITKVKNKEISEALITQYKLVLTDKNKERFVTKLDSGDATRTVLLGAIEEVNKEKAGSIKTTLEQSSSGWSWFILLNSLPFYLMWAATLVVIVYAVRTLSRNKG